ncbi:hypothetical protein JX266_005615 [Neoarthrinium moseri]|nr:hypothetical protein JX266_005615 [Neoarthrinium moseri]
MAEFSTRYGDGPSLKIPYESHVGAFLKQKYQIVSLQWEEGDLMIFLVTSLGGKQYEAQAFRICELPDKKYQARKRRLRRLEQCCEDKFVQSEMRIVVREIPGDGIERHRAAHLSKRRIPEKSDPCQPEFPGLITSKKPVTGRRNPSDGRPTYAQAASYSRTQPRCPIEYLSKTLHQSLIHGL